MVGDARFELTTELDGTQTNFGFSKSIILDFQRVFKRWSVMQDSNLRPLGPKPSALPSCANHRFLQFTLHWGCNENGVAKGT
jgi:hypothetical protein